MKTVHSNLLDIDLYCDEQDGLFILRHEELERTIQLQTRFTVEYKPVYMHLPECVVECCIVDNETRTRIIKVGETNRRTLSGSIATEYPGTVAYQRAFDRAAIAILQINEKKIFSNLEIVKSATEEKEELAINAVAAEPVKPAPKQEKSEAVLTDETVILLGQFNGKKYGDVKNDEVFKKFVNWLKEKKVRFPDEERNRQVAALIN